MDTIGTVIKNARIRKRFSHLRLEKETKIKKEFIKAIEEENWDKLPELTVVKGFVRNIASTLKINEKRAFALLRRDYPPKKATPSPKWQVFEEFVWSPRLTFFLGVFFVIVTVLGYLSFQYAKFVSPPTLNVFEPKESEVVTTNIIRVSGTTDSDAIIRVNNQPVIVDADGKFSEEIEVSQETGEILVKAVSRAGKETVLRRKITVELTQ